MIGYVKLFGMLCLSLGWVVPAYLSADSTIAWCRLEAAPVVYGHPGQLNSFPFLCFARQMLVLATSWLTCAVVFWVFYVSRITRGFGWYSSETSASQPQAAEREASRHSNNRPATYDEK